MIGIALLPPCMGLVGALARVLAFSSHATPFWVPAAAGAACWFSVYVLLPKPMLVYVFGHELTHALWTWLFGGRVKRFKVGARGGHVLITKSNSLIALAPYFFPIYVALTALLFAAGHLLWNWKPYLVWFHLLLGASYAFHVTLTFHALKTEQTDITSQGYFFSAVVIVFGNLLALLLGLAVLMDVGLLHSVRWWAQETAGVLLRLSELLAGRSR
ncbi:MAG: M50 family metallopeptidase [Verrucomicrobia bacterium]|nr:M50 family metallopeptidase [Verrucomicrobiota bacterium]